MAESDIPLIKAIDRLVFSSEEQYEDKMYGFMIQTGLSLVAVDGIRVVGYAFVQMNPYTHVRSLAIHPEYRRRGLGKALMQAVIDRADHEVDLLVDESNAPASRLYAQLGFRRAAICPALPAKRRMVLKLQ